ncbi:MAG: CRISPR-associated endonuclease Cas2 [Candidatus Nezhaarchaeales archaeon]
MMVLVIYDIPDDNLRLQVAKYLKRMGLNRVQKSAFIGDLTPALRAELVTGLQRLIRGKKANIQIYPLTQASFNQRIVLGVTLIYDDEDRLLT